MAKLARLIRGQDVAFDTHQRGDGQEVKWQELHLEKRLHHRGWKIRFPLFGKRVPSSSEGMPGKQYEKVLAEVRRELDKNPDLVQQLAETLAQQMQRFRGPDLAIETVIEGARKIAAYFDL